MTIGRRQKLAAMRGALEDVFGGDQSLEAEAMLDKLDDRGWSLWAPGMRVRSSVPELPLGSTRGLPKRRSAG